MTVGKDTCLQSFVLAWSHTRVVLEILAEKRLVGEIEAIGYLLHIHCGIFQEIFCLHDYRLVNPLGGGAPADALYQGGEIFRRQAQL